MSAMAVPFSSGRGRVVWRIAAGFTAAVFILALPVALITSTVRVLFGARPLYLHAVDAYDAPTVTGIPRSELVRGVDDLRAYLFDDRDRLSLQVTNAAGQTEPLFNEREVQHMRDVKTLVQGFFTAQAVSLLLLAAYAAPRLILQRRAGARHLCRLIWYAMLGVLAVGALFGITAVLSFEWLFTRFHLISFSNNLWLLDPRTDHLLQLFPDPFWRLATALLVGAILAETVLLAVLARLGWRWLDRRERQQSSAAQPA